MRARRAALRPAAALCFAATLAVLFLPARPAVSQGGAIAEFSRTEILTKGKITDVLVDDLDGDGRKDLLVVMGRELRFHFQREDGTFPLEPDQSFRLDPRALLFDTGDVDQAGKKALVILREDGVYAHRLETAEGRRFYGLKLERLVTTTTLLKRSSDEEARRKELLRDVNGDGKLDILVPVAEGFAIYPGLGGGKFGERMLLPSPPIATLGTGDDRLSSSLMGMYWIANPTVADFDADGKPDVVISQEGELSVFSAGADGKLAPAPSLRATIPGTKAFTLDAEKPFELDFTMPLVLRDLDHDGRIDAALTHVGQGTTRIFRNGKTPADAFKTPASVVRAKGVTAIAFFVDLDGDGLDDMILPRMDKVGIWSILKVVVTRSVPVEAQFYYQRKTGPLFPDEPDVVRAFEVPVSIHSRGDGLDVGTTLIASLDGDFDRDGKKDLVYRTGATTLGIFLGLDGRKAIAEKPALELPITTTDDYRFVLPIVEDMNGDGGADVVLRYQSWDRKDDRLLVFVSRAKPR